MADIKKSSGSFKDLRGLLAGSSSDLVEPEETRRDVGKGHAAHSDSLAGPGEKSVELTRPITVKCWRVIGQVAKATRRPELLAVLLRAREIGSTDAADIAGHLLFEDSSRRVVAQRLLQIAEAYRLLEQRDHRYVLTEAGQVALATEQVFVPEHGAWTIWASNDPLLGAPILLVEPWHEPTAYDEVNGKNRDSSSKRSFEELPSWLCDVIGVVTIPAAAGGLSTRIDHIEREGEVAEPEAALRAVWDVHASRLRLVGTLRGKPVDAALHAPAIPTDQVWMQLLESEGLSPQWDSGKHALCVGFDETAEGERESLLRTLTFRRPSVSGYGVFQAMRVDRVALRAKAADDATRWAEWRLRARVRDYVTSERFAVWTKEAVAPFGEFNPTTPSRKVLADTAWRTRSQPPSPGSWHLIAAEDWGL